MHTGFCTGTKGENSLYKTLEFKGARQIYRLLSNSCQESRSAEVSTDLIGQYPGTTGNSKIGADL